MKLNEEQATALGTQLQAEFTRYKSDRKEIEIQMMKNLRQTRGKYDPEVAEKLHPKRSKVYPRDTRVKLTGFVAKMMEMMFPTEGKNWGVKPTPMPTIQAADLDKIIQNLEQAAEAAEEPFDITSDMIEEAVQKFAAERADNMEVECADQLSEMRPTYPGLSKGVLRSGGTYGFGVTKGPLVKFKEDRIWEKNEVGVFAAKKVRIPRPLYKPVSSWDIYPDLSSPTWQDQSSIFERALFSRNGVKKLMKLKGFDNAAIKKYLDERTTGNYKEPTYASELNKINNLENVGKKKERRYEVIIYRGFITAHQLAGLGVKVDEDKMHEDRLVDVWMLDDIIIKLDHTPFGDVPADFYHAYIHGADEDSGILGVGIPEDLRDSQLSICATARMIQDNAAAVAGPIFEVNQDLLAKGKDIGSIHAFKVIYREGQGQEAQFQAVRQLNTESHIAELTALQKTHRETLDVESNLPAWLFGATQPLGEAFRTSSNMSMMQGGASMITKDHVRAFDNYVLSLIGSQIKWNKKWNDKENIKGDFEAMATGNQSLVAKELRGAALDQFWATLDQRERAMFNEYDVLVSRMEARDLPPTLLKLKPAAEAAAEAVTAAASAAAKTDQDLTVAKTEQAKASAAATTAKSQIDAQKLDPEVREIYANIEKVRADAQASGDTAKLDSIQLIMDNFAGQQQPEGQPQGGF